MREENSYRIIFSLLILLGRQLIQVTAAQCSFPKWYHGDFYSQEVGLDVTTTIKKNSWNSHVCLDILYSNDTVDYGGAKNAIIKVHHRSCYQCFYVMWRTENILQYKRGECVSSEFDFGTMVCRIAWPKADQLITMYRLKPVTVSCKTTFEGVYHFTYEIDEGGGGICNNQDSIIEACQEPGSAYVDNEVFTMTYGRCRGVANSQYKQIRYQCMGTWLVENGYMFAAIFNTVEKDNRERFKCLLTKKDQQPTDNQYRWVKTRFSDCRTLSSIRNGHERLVIQPVAPVTLNMQPSCNLPRNLSGTWYSVLEYESQVTINDTHIYYKTQIDEFSYSETYYSCQQTLGTRYLMTQISVGKCEIDFVCFDILPRHHSIIRYRFGKPNRLLQDEMLEANYLIQKFRQTCTWQAFVFNREDFDWKYNILIANPPSAVPCPIGGRFRFVQLASNEEEKYKTRIRGVTDKPRIQVDCRLNDSEWKSCTNDMNKIQVDAEYCETVDYRGRPIGEYDEPDHILTCVGYWMEDMRSYLITYDNEDPFSSFRCWVYERLTWTDVVMSRAVRAKCGRHQTAYSFDLTDGAGLSLQMYENERLFDDCPQRFDPGFDPYKKPMTIYVLNQGAHLRSQTSLFVGLAIILVFYVPMSLILSSPSLLE